MIKAEFLKHSEQFQKYLRIDGDTVNNCLGLIAAV